MVDEPLGLAPAIVVLGGGSPSRELAAAEVFRGGWAPRVLLVPARPPEGQNGDVLDDDRVVAQTVEQDVEARRAVLEASGVPAEAVFIASRPASNTLMELQVAAEVIRPGDAPVILVTSRYHSRRVQITWQFVTGGQSRAIVRVARNEAFDADRWWTSRQSIDQVVHEYLGIGNALLGFRLGA